MKDNTHEAEICLNCTYEDCRPGCKLLKTHRRTREPKQQPTRRSGKLYTYNGYTGTLWDWSYKLGIPHATLYNRMRKGMPPEAVFSEGRLTDRTRRFFEVDGEKLSYKQISERSGLPMYSVKYQLRNGMATAEELIREPERFLHPQMREYTYNGYTATLAEHAKRMGVSETTLRRRVRSGMPIEEALSIVRMRRLYEVDGEWLSVQEIAERTGVSVGAIRKRMERHGVDAEEVWKR